MHMTIVEQVIRIVIITPHDRIDAFTSTALRSQLEQLDAEGVCQIVIDLTDVPFLDSAGMAVLVTALKRARAAGGDLRLVWPKHEAARRILHLTKFDRVFTIAQTAAEATPTL